MPSGSNANAANNSNFPATGVAGREMLGPPVPWNLQTNPYATNNGGNTTAPPLITQNGNGGSQPAWPDRTASATNNGLAPVTPRYDSAPAWNTPQTSPYNGSATNPGTSGSNGYVPPANPAGNPYNGFNVPSQSQPNNGFPPRQPTGGNDLQTPQRSDEVDTAWNRNPSVDPAMSGFRPDGTTTASAADREPWMPAPRNGSLLAGYDVPAVPSQVQLIATPSAPGGTGEPSDAELEAQRTVTSGLPQAAIPGSETGPSFASHREGLPPSAGTRDEIAQINGMMYFLFLCSIGLNIYLGWIARGFYVRYRELAEELRASFSTV
jgi:hypothetical protein